MQRMFIINSIISLCVNANMLSFIVSILAVNRPSRDSSLKMKTISYSSSCCSKQVSLLCWAQKWIFKIWFFFVFNRKLNQVYSKCRVSDDRIFIFGWTITFTIMTQRNDIVGIAFIMFFSIWWMIGTLTRFWVHLTLKTLIECCRGKVFFCRPKPAN